MSAAGRIDRAVLGIGVASLASVVFVVEDLGDFRFMRVGGGSLLVAIGLGLLVIVAGWLGNVVLAGVAGAGFLLAALIQLISTATGNDWLGANLSTMSFWLGLGAGLLVCTTTALLAPHMTTEGHR
ncbi:Rv1678 family membrane protein [Phytoactinopolyspora limicola]|uniref:Rv1678 family membrane protein n=1 Tax=Phytoactinopolyspora limicola TaxID=2715536 RepID=UPI00140C9EEF|nr:hypothetical protein [Phytoactinopolyspora limicola]